MKFQLFPHPGPARRRQVVLLCAVLIAAGGLVWARLTPAERPLPASNSPAPSSRPLVDLSLPDPIQLEALGGVAEEKEAGRNPFGFGTRPAPPPPPQGAMSQAPPLPPALPPGPPPIQLRLTGMTVVAPGRTMVTLLDPSTKAIFQAFEGDTVDGRYRLIKVNIQSVEMSYLDGTGTRTIPLGG